MSERIFACLLRLYPARFRAEYGLDAMQLFRDRYRTERGLWRRTRLWMDLLVDLMTALPLVIGNSYGRQTTATAPAGRTGFPTFHLLEREPVRPGAFVFGSVVSVLALALFSMVLSHPGMYRSGGSVTGLRSPVEAALEGVNKAEEAAGAQSPWQSCTFERVEILAHNVGYFKLNSFPDPAMCGEAADGVMIRLSRVDALIFDLRENAGGRPETSERIAAWVTASPVRGNHLAGVPVYVLTSSQTSGTAEQFAHELQVSNRAIVVGERTAGDVVEPQMKATAANALNVAMQMASR